MSDGGDDGGGGHDSGLVGKNQWGLSSIVLASLVLLCVIKQMHHQEPLDIKVPKRLRLLSYLLVAVGIGVLPLAKLPAFYYLLTVALSLTALAIFIVVASHTTHSHTHGKAHSSVLPAEYELETDVEVFY